MSEGRGSWPQGCCGTLCEVGSAQRAWECGDKRNLQQAAPRAHKYCARCPAVGRHQLDTAGTVGRPCTPFPTSWFPGHGLLQGISHGTCPTLPSRKSSHHRPGDLNLSPENQTSNSFLIKQYSAEGQMPPTDQYQSMTQLQPTLLQKEKKRQTNTKVGPTAQRM